MRHILISLIAFAALGGCADLPPIAEGECGNAVLEPGEDCDTAASDCRPAGSVGQCHFDCSLLGDGSRRQCPSGWECGSDDACRQGSGRFVDGTQLYLADLTRVVTGDFDGDELTDLLTRSIRGLEVHYSDGDSFAQSRPLPPSDSYAAIGSLTTDPHFDDVVTADRFGIMVSRGLADRTMQPNVYSPYPLPPNLKASVVLVSGLGALLESNGDGESMILLVESELWPVDDKNPIKIGNLGVSAGDLAFDIVAGSLVEDPAQSPCDEIVYAGQGQSVVYVLELCTSDGTETSWNFGDSGQPLEQLDPVTLAGFGGEQPDGALLVDVNGDGHLDLLVTEEISSTTYVSYGLGDGRFHSNPTELGLGTADQLAGPLAVTVTGEQAPVFGGMPRVVAAGDLNGDSAVDYVTSQGVLVSISPPPPSFEDVEYAQLWQGKDALAEARIVDLNQNGIPDVVALEANSQEMVFLNGAGAGLLNEFRIPLGGRASDLAVGDFDGDLLLDVAFRRTDLHASSGGDTLAIGFGQPYGAPSAPLSMGKLATIDQILAAPLSYDPPDAISDLVVLSHQEAMATLAVLIGTSSRQLLSPFVLAQGEGDATSEEIPVAVATGEFDGEPGHRDLAAIGVPSKDWSLDLGAWLLPSTGEAAISAATVTRTALATTLGIAPPLLAAVDLDADGIDELVGLYGTWGDNGPEGRLLVVRSEPQGSLRAWAVPPAAQVLSESYGASGDSMGGGSIQPGAPGGPDDPVEISLYRGHIEVADVTDDGLPDVIALSESYGQDWSYWTAVVVFPNDGSGDLDAGQRIALDHQLLGSHTGFTVANIDADPGAELLVLTADGVYLVDVALPASDWQKLFDFSGGVSLAAGDFEHDGVLDLAVGFAQGVATFRGQALLP